MADNNVSSVKEYAEAHRGTSPSPVVENSNVPVRGSRYGEIYTMAALGSKLYPLADEGAYFVASNTTPGTGIAGHAAPTTLDDTKALLYIQNTRSTSDGGRVYLDYIRLYITAAGTNSTNVRFNYKTDTGTTRFSSGGSAITPVNPNTNSGLASQCTVKFGAVVCAAATANARSLGGLVARPVIGVVSDMYQINFGASDRSLNSIITSGTNIAFVDIGAPPVVLGPGDTFLLHQWSGSQSGAISFEFEFGYWER